MFLIVFAYVRGARWTIAPLYASDADDGSERSSTKRQWGSIHLHPPLDREPDDVFDSLAVMEWWAREGFSGNAVLVQYGELLQVLEREPRNAALRKALLGDETFTMASLTQVA